MTYKIAVCDDDPAELEHISGLVHAWSEKKRVAVEISVFASAEEFLFEYGGSDLFDILLLDVEMRTISGIDLAKRLRKTDRRAEIIFITSHAEFIGEGYEVDALHYLIKPIGAEKLAPVLDKAAEKLSREPESVVGETLKLSEDKIIYVESFSHCLVVHTAGCDFRIRESISAFEAKLSKAFFRIHRSFIIYLPRVIRISRTEVTLDGDITLPISRGLYDEVNRAFIDNN